MLNNTVTAFKAGSATTRMSSMEDAQVKVLSQGFSNYAQQTSLHGWQYIDIEPGWFRKTFWAIVSFVTSLEKLCLAKFSGEEAKPKVYEKGHTSVLEIWY